MHGHECGHGEHNEYLYYEASAEVTSAEVTDQQEYQQEPENQESQNNIEFRVDGDNQLEIDDV